MYHIVRAPVFGKYQNSAPESIREKSMEVYPSGQMICNYNVCCWPTTSSNILIVDYNSAKRGLKVTYCIVKSAEYWCPYSTVHGK